MLGTLENAHVAATLDPFGDKPEGWEFIGSGSFRRAYRGPDGLVYKVDSDPGNVQRSEEYGNRSEWNAFVEWIERGATSEHAELPECWLWDNGVMCVEHVQPDGTDVPWERVYEFAKSLVGGAYLWTADLHPGNYVVRQGRVVIIDFGHWSMGPQIDWWKWEEEDRIAHPELWECEVKKVECNCGCGDFWEDKKWVRLDK
jgi:hypothetical protein